MQRARRAGPNVFLVKTADGNLGAFKILSYNAGSYHLALTYAGAGNSSF